MGNINKLINPEQDLKRLKGKNMRKIEKNMMTAIQKCEDWSSGNTSVTQFEPYQTTQVRLHGHLIAIIRNIETDSWQRNDIELSSCGWETVTTKSRLNALLNYTPWRIVQKNFEWFAYCSMTNQMMPFYDGIKLPY